MAAFDHFGDMYDVALKPRLLDSLTRAHIPLKDRPSSSRPSELSKVISLIKTHSLLSESFTESMDPKIVKAWKSAVTSWISRILSLTPLSSIMPDKCWVGVSLLGVTSEECSSERFLESYTVWFQELLNCLQSPTDSSLVRVAACTSMSDLLSRLSRFPQIKKDGSSRALKVVQPVLRMLHDDKSEAIWEAAVHVLCTMITSFPFSIQRHYDSVESAIAVKLFSRGCSLDMLKKLVHCLALLPKSKGDEGSWFLMMQKILILINDQLNLALQGLEEETIRNDFVRLLVLPGEQPPPPLGGYISSEEANNRATKRSEQSLTFDVSILISGCGMLVANTHPLKVKIPVCLLVTLVERILMVNGSLPEMSMPFMTAKQQENICSELPVLHLCSLELLTAIIKAAGSQILPFAGSITRIITMYFKTCALPELRIKVYSAAKSLLISRGVGEALSHPEWRQAMIDEMCALQSSGTWELTSLPPGKSVVGCRWIYTVKVGPDGKIDRFKARLVAKGYTQIFGLDYGDTFSPVAKMASVRLLLSMAAIRHWPLHQLDIKNAFLHGDLKEEVYMEQPPGFVAQGESSNMVCRLHRSLYGLKQSPRAWFGRFSSVVQQFGMIRSNSDHSVFYRHSAQGCVYLVVYVDDIVITGSDQQGIVQLKQYLSRQFQTKDLGKLRYFLGIEVAQSKDGLVISQRKYAMDILEETGLLNAKPVDTPMDPNVKLLPNQGEPLSDPGRYRRLVGKLNYLTVTRPDISFAVSVVSQFLNSPCQDHWDAVIRILKYIKNAPGKGLIYDDKGHTHVVGYSDADWAGSPIDRRSTTGYCVLVGGNLISWKSKKQNVVARSSAEAEYRAMALVTQELMWLQSLLKELKFGEALPMTLICDNQAALHIASNPVFHERTKHIEVDCHYIREKIESGDITTSFVNSNDQLADVFTKSLRGPRVSYICNKLGAFDLYAPA